jgi:nucleoid-associated protein YgaU
MTKETKIGLLVGLAFIVLFAIILSEKGTTHRDGRVPNFIVADSATNSTNLGTDQPLGDKGRLPVNGLAPIISPTETRPPVAMTRFDEEQVAQPTLEEDPLPEFTQDVVSRLNDPPLAEQPDLSTDTPSPAVSTPRETAKPTQLAMGTVNPAPGTSIMKPGTMPKIPAAIETSRSTPKDETLSEAKARIAQQVGIKVKNVHQVEPGESLTKIAAKSYGRSTPGRVEAIYDANRDVLKTPASVRAGDKLKIPELGEGFEAAPDFALSTANRTVTPMHAAPDQQLRIPIPMAENPKAETKLALVPLNKTPLEKTGTKTQTPVAKTAVKQPEIKVATKLPEHEHGTKAASKSDKKKKDDSVAFVWYEVKKTDTLSKIAKKEMGSERDSGALYKINQDIINNRNAIKPGMKIRVPAKLQGTTELPSAITTRSLDATDD